MPSDQAQQAWDALKAHYANIKDTHMRDLFANDSQRYEIFHIALGDLLCDYSKHRITQDTMGLLNALAQASDVEKKRDAMFKGAPINDTENRAVLHTALRGSVDSDVSVNGENIKSFVDKTLDDMKRVSEYIRSNDAITDILYVGIGGSILGPEMACTALQGMTDGPDIHFISNIDAAPLARILPTLSPKNTAIIIASKTFTTAETMANANAVKRWLVDGLGNTDIAKHMIAITQNTEGAKAFGVEDDYILEMRDWIGGRYSLWSGIGLPIAIVTGFENFTNLLNGAHAMDTHFKTAPLAQNMPVIMAMIGVWYRNVFDYNTHTILPYAQDLEKLTPYIQQLDMESNGKAAAHKTSPVIFGGPGTNSQHAFFQMLHQGDDIIPADFIAVINPEHDMLHHHNHLLANALAQSQALMSGRHADEVHKTFPGNRPSSTLLLKTLDPYNLGMLLALYEHKTFVQGCIWGINSYDQWGVELGKDLAKNLLQNLETDQGEAEDSSTQSLIAHIKNQKNT